MDLDQLVERQHGVISRRQAAEHRLTRSGLAHRVRRGRWRRSLPGVYVVGPRRDPLLAAASAALQWGGPAAVLSHHTAARLHGLPLPGTRRPVPPAVHVMVARGRVSRRRAGLVCHRPRRLPGPDDVVRVGGLRVTTRARTVADLLTVTGRARRTGYVAQCLVQRFVTREQLEAAVRRRPAALGERRLRRCLAELGEGAQSGSEVDGARRLRAAGLVVVVQRRFDLPGLGSAHVDLALEDSRVAIEIDGRPFHESLEAQDRDRRRDELLRAQGWEVVRVAAELVRRDPRGFVDRVRTVHLARLAAAP
jgi:very-short-patch-repair endonuclease